MCRARAAACRLGTARWFCPSSWSALTAHACTLPSCCPAGGCNWQQCQAQLGENPGCYPLARSWFTVTEASDVMIYDHAKALWREQQEAQRRQQELQRLCAEQAAECAPGRCLSMGIRDPSYCGQFCETGTGTAACGCGRGRSHRAPGAALRRSAVPCHARALSMPHLLRRPCRRRVPAAEVPQHPRGVQCTQVTARSLTKRSLDDGTKTSMERCNREGSLASFLSVPLPSLCSPARSGGRLLSPFPSQRYPSGRRMLKYAV